MLTVHQCLILLGQRLRKLTLFTSSNVTSCWTKKRCVLEIGNFVNCWFFRDVSVKRQFLQQYWGLIAQHVIGIQSLTSHPLKKRPDDYLKYISVWSYRPILYKRQNNHLTLLKCKWHFCTHKSLKEPCVVSLL